MGNEPSSTANVAQSDDRVDDEAAAYYEYAQEILDNHNRNKYSGKSFPPSSAGEESNGDSDELNENHQRYQQGRRIQNRSQTEQQKRRSSLNRSLHSGSLRANLQEAVDTREHVSDESFDPVFSAAAAGAEVRKAKQLKLKHQHAHQLQTGRTPTQVTQESCQHRTIQAPIKGQQSQLDSQKEHKSSSASPTIDWASSLRRFAASAASTATTAAHVAAPVIKDASSVVARSAADFAQSYQEEAKKSARASRRLNTMTGPSVGVPNTLLERSSSVDVGSFNDEEIVFRSPTRSWLETPTRSLFLTHGSYHNNHTSSSPARMRGGSLISSPSTLTSPHTLRLVPTETALRASEEIPLPTLRARTSLQPPSSPKSKVSEVIEETEDEGGNTLSEVPTIAAPTTRTADDVEKSLTTANEKERSAVTTQKFDHPPTSQDCDDHNSDASSNQSSQISPISSIDTNGTMDEQVEQVDEIVQEVNERVDIVEKGLVPSTEKEYTTPRIEQGVSFATVSSSDALPTVTVMGESGSSNFVLPIDAPTGEVNTDADNGSQTCDRSKGHGEEAPSLLRRGSRDMDTGQVGCESTTEEIAPRAPKVATLSRPNIERMSGSLNIDTNPEGSESMREESEPSEPKEDISSRPNIARMPGSLPSINDTTYQEQWLQLSTRENTSEKRDCEGATDQSEEAEYKTDVQMVADLEPAEEETRIEAFDNEALPEDPEPRTKTDNAEPKSEESPLLPKKTTEDMFSDPMISELDAGSRNEECAGEDAALEATKTAYHGGHRKTRDLAESEREALEDERVLEQTQASNKTKSITVRDNKHDSVTPTKIAVDNVEPQIGIEQLENRRGSSMGLDTEGGDLASLKTDTEKASLHSVGPAEQNSRKRFKGATHRESYFVLFDADADGMYEATSARTLPSASSSTMTFTSVDENQSTRHLNAPSPRVKPDKDPRPPQSILSRAQQDPKGLVEFLASKLTGYDVQIRKRDDLDEVPKRSWINETQRSIAYNFDESVFAQQRKPSRSPSLSPPCSPPDMSSIDEGGSSDSASLSGSKTESITSLWDMIPEKKILNGAVRSELNLDEIEQEAQLTPTSRLRDRDSESFVKGPTSQSAPASIAGSGKFGTSRDRSFVDLTTLASDPALKRQSRRPKKGGWTFSGKISSRPLMAIPANTGHSFGMESAGKSGEQKSSRTSESTIGDEKYVSEKAAEPRDTVKVNRADTLPFKPSDSNDVEAAGPESIMVGWDQEMAFQFPNVPDTEDMTEGFEREELLDEALLAFSSLDNIDFLDKVPRHRSTAEKSRVAAVRWKQLVANWRHSETWKAMNTRPCSIHFFKEGQQSDRQDGAESTSSSTLIHRWNGSTDLGDGLNIGDATSGVRNLSGLSPHLGDGEFLVLSGYLCELGPHEQAVLKQNALKKTAEESLLKHKLTVEDSADGAISITDLLKAAESKLSDFTNLVRGIADYASHNEPPSMAYSVRANSVSFSVGVKNYSSIRQKASRKYGGDILLVKDILRGQVTFPDEGALACGLHYLSRQCNTMKNSTSEDSSKKAMTVEIVRLKNLFRVTRMGNSFPSPLPTGYRHILLNVRLDGQLVVEIQFQLAQMFNVMGAEGYAVHRDLTKLEPVHEAPINPLDATSSNGEIGNSPPDLYAKLERILTKVEHPTQPSLLEASSSSDNKEAIRNSEDTKNDKGHDGNLKLPIVETNMDNEKPEQGKAILGCSITGTGAEVKTQASKHSAAQAPGSGPPVGIAAMAAAAAAKKKEEEASGESSTQTPGGPPVGIAAMAAAAAAKKKKKEASGESSTQTPGSGPPVGIAAMAAAAAAKKKKETSGEDSTHTPGLGLPVGIAAMAAAKKPSNVSDDLSPQSGGVAATRTTKPKEIPTSSVKARVGSKGMGVDGDDGVSGHVGNVPEDIAKGEPQFDLELFSALMEVGVAEASANPRDLSSFYCLHVLTKFNMERVSTGGGKVQSVRTRGKADGKLPSPFKDMSALSKKCLLRSIAITNQATSVGMVGWLEYGSSDPLERTIDVPFDVLQQLACHYALDGDWVGASDVLSALVLRCEQQLPLYHPTTLSSMIDLAAALIMTNESNFASGIIGKVSDRLSLYLSEQETIYFDTARQRVDFEFSKKKCFRLDNGMDAISMLKAFVNIFQRQLSREFMALFGPDHVIALVNKSLLADAFAVLANCLAASNRSSLEDGCTSGHSYYWSLAYLHYKDVFKVFVESRGLGHPSTSSVVCSLARCLRELGKLDEALQILNSAVSFLGEHQVDTKDTVTDTNIIAKESLEGNDFSPFTFLPPSIHGSVGRLSPPKRLFCYQQQSAVLCLWLMAVITVERSPDERGRIRALSLLHGASEGLQHAILEIGDNDEQSREACFEMYECVEREARDLFQPWLFVQGSSPTVEAKSSTSVTSKTARWDAFSLMRQKRWENKAAKQTFAAKLETAAIPV